jgi:NADPH:quinone reductase-like Zn-dependent oxidoreductase
MRAVRYHAFGKPADVLQLDEVPTPEPEPSEVRVRLTHRSLNPADLHTVLGHYGNLPDLPAVGGHEGVGYVDLIGHDVSGIKSGQRVIPLGIEGTWQEQIVITPDDLFAVPDAVPDEAAAQLFVNPLTAWWMLDALGLGDGDWLLQTGATSQVGRLVIQLARRRGVRTVNLIRRVDARDELTTLGADAVIVTEAGDDAKAVRKRILDLTDGGADGAVDCVAGAVGTLAASCLSDSATMLVYGGLSGEPLALDAGPLIFRRAAVRGFWRTRQFELIPRDETRTALTHLALLIADGDLVLPLEATYDLADVREAVAHSRASGRSGKVLLTG